MEKAGWFRTCQSCGHIQSATQPDPSKPLPLNYLDGKCRSCKSIDLDYGKFINKNEIDC